MNCAVSRSTRQMLERERGREREACVDVFDAKHSMLAQYLERRRGVTGSPDLPDRQRPSDELRVRPAYMHKTLRALSLATVERDP